MKLDNSVKGVKVKRNNIVSEVAGVRVKKNGVITTVWVAAEPFEWITDSVVQGAYPSEYGVVSLTPSNSYCNKSLTKFALVGSVSANSGFIGKTDEVDTGNNKYMEIALGLVSNGGKVNKFTVAGNDYSAEVVTNGVITVDVSGQDTVSIEVDITAWSSNTLNLYIKSIRFYS